MSEIADPSLFVFSWGRQPIPMPDLGRDLGGVATLSPTAHCKVLSLTPQAAHLHFDAEHRVDTIRVVFDPTDAAQLISAISEKVGEPDSVLEYVPSCKALINWMIGEVLVTVVHAPIDDPTLEVVVSPVRSHLPTA